MASIGEVTATLKAEIGQYVGPMQQAAQATAQIQQSVENASKALIAEGAAGTAASKGLAVTSTATAALAQQLAAAEGRVTQLQAGFAALGIQAQGREFARATAEVARLKAELAATGNAAPNLGPQLEVPLKKIPAAATNAASTLTHLRGSLTAIASSVAGVPGPVGNLASKLLMFGVGGAVTVGVTAGLAVLGLAFAKMREKAVAENERISKNLDDLLQKYRERTGFFARQAQEDAQNALQAAQERLTQLQARRARPTTGTGREVELGPLEQDIAAVTAEINTLQLQVDQAKRNVREFGETGRKAFAALTADALSAETATRQEADALRLAADNLRAMRDAGVNVFGDTSDLTAAQQAQRIAQANLALQRDMNTAVLGDEAALQRVAAVDAGRVPVLRQLRDLAGELTALSTQELATLEASAQAAMERAGLAENQAEAAKRLAGLKADTSIKDSVRAGQEEALNATRDVAAAMARAFTSSFGDQQQSITDRVAASLGSALRAALEKVLAEKIFAGFLNALFGGIFGGGGFLGGLFGGGKSADVSAKFSAPTLAMPALESAGNAIVVPLNNLPPARSPVEMARDQLHQAVWVETARVALQNGVNLQPRFR